MIPGLLSRNPLVTALGAVLFSVLAGSFLFFLLALSPLGPFVSLDGFANTFGGPDVGKGSKYATIYVAEHEPVLYTVSIGGIVWNPEVDVYIPSGVVTAEPEVLKFSLLEPRWVFLGTTGKGNVLRFRYQGILIGRSSLGLWMVPEFKNGSVNVITTLGSSTEDIVTMKLQPRVPGSFFYLVNPAQVDRGGNLDIFLEWKGVRQAQVCYRGTTVDRQFVEVCDNPVELQLESGWRNITGRLPSMFITDGALVAIRFPGKDPAYWVNIVPPGYTVT